jgi:hypothetical protein
MTIPMICPGTDLRSLLQALFDEGDYDDQPQVELERLADLMGGEKRAMLARYQIVAWHRLVRELDDKVNLCRLDEEQRERDLREQRDEADRMVRAWNQWEKGA